MRLFNQFLNKICINIPENVSNKWRNGDASRIIVIVKAHLVEKSIWLHKVFDEKTIILESWVSLVYKLTLNNRDNFWSCTRLYWLCTAAKHVMLFKSHFICHVYYNYVYFWNIILIRWALENKGKCTKKNKTF